MEHTHWNSSREPHRNLPIRFRPDLLWAALTSLFPSGFLSRCFLKFRLRGAGVVYAIAPSTQDRRRLRFSWITSLRKRALARAVSVCHRDLERHPPCTCSLRTEVSMAEGILGNGHLPVAEEDWARQFLRFFFDSKTTWGRHAYRMVRFLFYFNIYACSRRIWMTLSKWVISHSLFTNLEVSFSEGHYRRSITQKIENYTKKNPRIPKQTLQKKQQKLRKTETQFTNEYQS